MKSKINKIGNSTADIKIGVRSIAIKKNIKAKKQPRFAKRLSPRMLFLIRFIAKHYTQIQI
jgi:hypothetical protein